MSFGGIVAYLIGGVFSAMFPKRKILLGVSLCMMLLAYILYTDGFGSRIALLGIITFIGILYSFWSITKNALIYVEVKKTGKNDVFVNGAA